MDDASGQEITKRTYDDPAFARAFLAKNGTPHGSDPIPAHVLDFAKRMTGNRLIDVGCGPGIDARRFASLGLQVTGIDYSAAMIEAAKRESLPGNPTYLQLDMRQIGAAFEENSFDSAWISASLIHVPESDVSQVLSGVHRILVSNGQFRISLKAGKQGAQLVHDDKYGIEIDREFIFWQRENFEPLLQSAGFEVLGAEVAEGGVTGSEPTVWLRFTGRSL